MTREELREERHLEHLEQRGNDSTALHKPATISGRRDQGCQPNVEEVRCPQTSEFAACATLLSFALRNGRPTSEVNGTANLQPQGCLQPRIPLDWTAIRDGLMDVVMFP